MKSMRIAVQASATTVFGLCAAFTAGIAHAGSVPDKPADAAVLELKQPIAQAHKGVLDALKKLHYRIDTREGKGYLSASSGPPLSEALEGAVRGKRSRVSELKIWLEETESITRVYISASVQIASPGEGSGQGQLSSSVEEDKKEQEAVRSKISKP